MIFQVLTASRLLSEEKAVEAVEAMAEVDEELEVLVKLLEGEGDNSSSTPNLLDQQTLLINEEAVFNFAPIKSNSNHLTIEVSWFPCRLDRCFLIYKVDQQKKFWRKLKVVGVLPYKLLLLRENNNFSSLELLGNFEVNRPVPLIEVKGLARQCVQES